MSTQEPSVYTIGQDYDPYRSWAGSQYDIKYNSSLNMADHPGTRPLSSVDHPGTRPALNMADHPGTRLLGAPSSQPASYPQNQNGNYRSDYYASSSRPGKLWRNIAKKMREYNF